MEDNCKVAVVTGSNRGIGYSIVKLLSQRQPPPIVYLTARDATCGQAAVDELRRNYVDGTTAVQLRFAQLDIESIDSIRKLRDRLAKEHPNGIDFLFNNAGILPPSRDESSTPEEFRFNAENVRKTVRVNFFGTWNICREFASILSSDARIVNLSSGMASVAFRHLSPDMQTKIETCSNLNEAVALMENFVSLDPDDYQHEGWLAMSPGYEIFPGFAIGDLLPYGISKIGINLLTRLLQKHFDSMAFTSNIIVNACCPGSVNTELNKYGTKTPDEGADTPLFLATMLPSDTKERGVFFADRNTHDPFRYRPPW